MTWRNEFPIDFDVPEPIATALQDRSYGNDACPSFDMGEGTPVLWVDHPDAEQREFATARRFTVVDGDETLFATDDTTEALAAYLRITQQAG